MKRKYRHFLNKSKKIKTAHFSEIYVLDVKQTCGNMQLHEKYCNEKAK